MKRLYLLFAIALLASGCSDKNPQNQSDEPDGYTRATPKGGELLPTERGPVRDVFHPPPLDMNTFALTVDGLVDTSLLIPWPQLMQMQSVTTDTTIMYCVEGWEVFGVWQGVPIAELVISAKPLSAATHVLFYSVDGYTTAMPLPYLIKYNALLAYEVNGAALLKHDGFPLRLIAPGLFGYKWAKYVHRLQVIDGPRLGFWERLGYDDEAIVPLERRFFYEGMNAQPVEY